MQKTHHREKIPHRPHSSVAVSPPANQPLLHWSQGGTRVLLGAQQVQGVSPSVARPSPKQGNVP